jgi:type II secretory pathway component GspD/PulD (secretin)
MFLTRHIDDRRPEIGAEINKEAGTPGISKMPVIGRLFSNRSKVKDQQILLILVKPTIIIKEEAEEEYFAPLKDR